MWHSSLVMNIQSVSYGHNDCFVTHGEKRWRFTGFYRNLVAAQHSHSWKLIKSLSCITKLKSYPWVVGGTLMRSFSNWKKVEEYPEVFLNYLISRITTRKYLIHKS